MIEAVSLTKRFDDIVALDHVDASIREGQVFGLIGTNGAGKSTFLRCLSGIYKPDEGQIMIDGSEVYEHTALKSRFFFISDEQYFFPGATPLDMASSYGTYYRYFDKKSGIEDLLVFKIVYEAKAYNEKYKEEAKKDSGKVFLNFVYENKSLFRLMYKNGLTTSIMKAFDALADWPEERDSAYLRAFFVYGFFGVVYQWIKYDFDETPEQIQRHTAEVIFRAVKEQQGN